MKELMDKIIRKYQQELRVREEDEFFFVLDEVLTELVGEEMKELKDEAETAHSELSSCEDYAAEAEQRASDADRDMEEAIMILEDTDDGAPDVDAALRILKGD